LDALERDFYEERRRKWRRSSFWRGFGLAAVLGAVVAAVSLGALSTRGATRSRGWRSRA
jgi:anti-sigma-K factor RskA